MQLIRDPYGLRLIKFSMHGRPRLFAGRSFIGIFGAMVRQFFRELS